MNNKNTVNSSLVPNGRFVTFTLKDSRVLNGKVLSTTPRYVNFVRNNGKRVKFAKTSISRVGSSQ